MNYGTLSSNKKALDGNLVIHQLLAPDPCIGILFRQIHLTYNVFTSHQNRPVQVRLHTHQIRCFVKLHSMKYRKGSTNGATFGGIDLLISHVLEEPHRISYRSVTCPVSNRHLTVTSCHPNSHLHMTTITVSTTQRVTSGDQSLMYQPQSIN